MLGSPLVSVLCFFFFQAEDGIRDLIVTGVQTCALPIFEADAVLVPRDVPGDRDHELAVHARERHDARPRLAEALRDPTDGEIGRASCREKCRSRWSPYH